MDNQQVDQLIAVYGGRFPMASFNSLRSRLQDMDFDTASLYLTQTKDPTISIILSILAGSLGLDRIYIGDTGIGILKLITCGGMGLWWLIDLFLIMDATKEKNMFQLLGMRQ